MNRLVWLCIGRTGACMGTMAFAGALPVLRHTWHMSAGTAGTIQTAFNLSNAIALLAAAWLSDSFGAKRVYLWCTWAGTIALACFALFARSPETALVLIIFVGLTQGGSYAPALMLAADLSLPSKRGRAMGMMLAAGSFGYLLSVFFSLWATQTFGVAAGFGVCAVGVFAGTATGQLSLAGMQPVEHAKHDSGKANASAFRWRSTFTPVAVCLLIGYIAHCWELLGHYAWTPSLLAAALEPLHLKAVTSALIVGAVVHLSGMLATTVIGALSDRLDRAKVLVFVGAAGAACSLLMGWSIHWGPAWTVVIAAIGSFFILGDSGVLSAAMTDEVPPASLGRVMGVRSVLGFGSGALAPAAFGAAFDATHQWASAYATLAAGGLAACAAAVFLSRLTARSAHRERSSGSSHLR